MCLILTCNIQTASKINFDIIGFTGLDFAYFGAAKCIQHLLALILHLFKIFYSDRQDSRSHSSRRSSPESDRQVHSRSGSFDSRERLQDRDRHEHDRERERERRDGRQREWDRDVDKDWPRNRDRDRIREREREREKRREMERERERQLPDTTERDRDRTLDISSQKESTKHSEPKLDRDHEKEFDGTCRDTATSEKERTEKDLGALQGFEDGNEAEKGESVEGEIFWKETRLLVLLLPLLT